VIWRKNKALQVGFDSDDNKMFLGTAEEGAGGGFNVGQLFWSGFGAVRSLLYGFLSFSPS